MTDPITNDMTMRLAQSALDGLARRQEVISQNLANVDTPGYQAQNLSFENLLQRQLGHDHQLALSVTHAGHLAAPGASLSPTVGRRETASLRADGNNVDIDVELNEMSETGLRYQALTETLSKKLQILKSIASDR